MLRAGGRVVVCGGRYCGGTLLGGGGRSGSWMLAVDGGRNGRWCIVRRAVSGGQDSGYLEALPGGYVPEQD
jgi:hypothetical protein